MRRTRTGWVAQAQSGKQFSSEGIMSDGVYLAVSAKSVHFHLAGTTDDEAGVRLQLPCDPSLLRELAKALNEAANWRDQSADKMARGLHALTDYPT